MLSADTYNLWFAPLRAGPQENNSITLEVANDFCEVWLKDNYMGLLQDVIALASGRQLQVKFKVGAGGGNAHRRQDRLEAVGNGHGNDGAPLHRLRRDLADR